MSAQPTPDVPIPETTVDDPEAVRCSRCGRPFPREHLLALHRGERHAGDLTDGERAAYEEAVDEEREALFLFHLKVITAIGVLYSVFVVVYMVVLG